MKKPLLILILLTLAVTVAEGQLWKSKRYEFITSLGTSQFFGDIGGYSKTENLLGFKDISLLSTRFNIDLQARYRMTNDLAVKLSLAFGKFHCTDEKGSNEIRGFESKTGFFEPTILGEYYFIKSNRENSFLFQKGRRTPWRSIISSIDVYAFTGFGGLSYNVKGNQALESYGMTKSGFTAVIPVGIGMNLLYKPDYNLGLELGGRYSFSDYLDGYTSQFSKSNDVYYFLNLTFTYKIPTNAKGIPVFLSKRKY